MCGYTPADKLYKYDDPPQPSPFLTLDWLVMCLLISRFFPQLFPHQQHFQHDSIHNLIWSRIWTIKNTHKKHYWTVGPPKGMCQGKFSELPFSTIFFITFHSILFIFFFTIFSVIGGWSKLVFFFNFKCIRVSVFD